MLPARLLLLAVAACGARAEEPPEPRPPSPPAAAAPAAELRVAVAAMVSPVATFEDYDPLLRHLAGALGRTHQLVQRRTYREINQMLLDGELDLAFVCSGTYAALPEGAPVELLAVPVVQDRAVYHGIIVTRTAEPWRTFDDLRGTRFAFSDALSNTGYLFPRELLADRRETPESFFSGTFFTGGHDRSIVAVYRQLADAAAVHELVYNAVVTPDSPYHGHLRILATSPDYPTPPVVSPTTVPAEVRARLKDALLGLDGTPEGRALLADLGFTAFVPGDPADYLPIRQTVRRMGGP